jgi:hypothetical protein
MKNQKCQFWNLEIRPLDHFPRILLTILSYSVFLPHNWVLLIKRKINFLFSFYFATGDASRGDKNTELIREFEGDLMNMTMKVGDVICKRFYQKIID